MATNKILLAALALGSALFAQSCRTAESLERAQIDYINQVRKTTSGAATADSTSKRAQAEIALLDSLQRKYPGRTRRTVVRKVETVTVPGKTVFVEVAPKVDTPKNQVVVDSLLAELESQAANYRQDLALKTEVSSVKEKLLRELNKRGYLPDTTVLFPNAPGYWLRIHRQPSGKYEFTLNTPARSAQVATQTEQITHTPPVYITTPLYKQGGFWAAVGSAVLGWGLLSIFLYLYYKRPAVT